MQGLTRMLTMQGLTRMLTMQGLTRMLTMQRNLRRQLWIESANAGIDMYAHLCSRVRICLVLYGLIVSHVISISVFISMSIELVLCQNRGKDELKSKHSEQMNSKKVKGPHEDLTYRIIGVGMAVHRQLGPGYREVIYQRSLEQALTENGISFDPEEKLPVYNNGNLLGYYIPDFIIENKVILEIKAYATVHQKYLGQVITYLNHTGLPIGLLMNFGERSLRTRRVFPSPPATEFRHNHQWIYVPKWLKEQKRNQTEDLPF